MFNPGFDPGTRDMLPDGTFVGIFLDLGDVTWQVEICVDIIALREILGFQTTSQFSFYHFSKSHFFIFFHLFD